MIVAQEREAEKKERRRIAFELLLKCIFVII